MTNRKGRTDKFKGSNILACAKGGTAGIWANLEKIGYGGECWATKRFDQCAELIRDTVDPSDMRGVPYIGLEHIAEGQLELAGHGSTEQVTSIKSRFRKGDILFGKLRPYFRKVVIAPFDGVCSTDIWVVRARQGIDLRYLFYWMASCEFIEESTRASEGTRMPRAQWEFVGRIEKPVPPLKEQQAIAFILGTLDDKIEVNRRMNRTLEEMARAIFKSWFIDFDPVRAKAAVRREHPNWTNEQISRAACPNLKPEIAALFPDSFEDSELGEIPKGWKIQSFTDEVEVIGGGTPKTSVPEYWGGEIPWFSVVDTPAPGEVFVVSTQKTITTEGLNSSSARILSVGTTIISARGTVGNLALVGVPMAMNQSCYGLRPRHGRRGYYVYFATAALVEILRQRAHGSVFSTITRETLGGTQVVAPPSDLMQTFERVVDGLLKRVLANQHQSRTLAALRDVLLPKLISGELRVPDAERIVGRCV
jgi:type I restriction enzyme S subunit